MSMESARWSLLHHRLDLLDCAIIGEHSHVTTTSPTTSYHANLAQLKQRLGRVTEWSAKMDKDLPDLVQCRELSMKLRPILHRTKTSLNQIAGQLETILVTKSELEAIIGQLLFVGEAASTSVNFDVDVSPLQKKLDSVESLLTTLSTAAKQQTQEVDDFLEMYEVAMEILSDTCNKWESILSTMEQ